MAELIAAVATGGSRSAVGVVRLSGPGAADCAGAVFSAPGGRPLREHPPRQLVYGALVDAAGESIDRCLATWSPAPHSYTGEETAELQCHGSPTVLSLALEALFAHGARQAGPGEFTRRAFLNGKLDLLEAEAVADLIDAESTAAVHSAAGRLSGALSARVEEIYGALADLLAHFCAVLDYPDEEIDAFGAETITAALAAAKEELRGLLDTYRRGRYLHGGLPCAIVGRPNVGKSTLLNALVGYDRAIVTPVPGTTRDTVEERCELAGVPLRLIDTAGVRETNDPVERLGVERSRAAMEAAELILAVVDLSADLTEEDMELLRTVEEAGKLWILVASKKDLVGNGRSLGLAGGNAPSVELSARTGEGLEELEAAVAALFPAGAEEARGEQLTNARQAGAVSRALEAVEGALAAQREGMAPDAVLTDVEGALAALGELTGKNVPEDVTGRIFQRFCVGK